MKDMKKWLSRTSLLLGVWILASPFVLGYWRVTSALWSQIVTGVLVALVALWQIIEVDGEPPSDN
jgi:membrane protein YdbS with pleckstrin-like domain